jgi:catechol 2,3-dioxygenase-like lactoylglutathione lyase family enzyme
MRLGYVIVYVPDVGAAVAFYEQAFGLTLRFVDDSGQFAEMDTGATALAFAHEALVRGDGVDFVTPRADQIPAGVEIALVTDRVAAAVERAVEAGAALVTPPHDKPWGQTVAYVRDLNGVLVELCTPVG